MVFCITLMSLLESRDSYLKLDPINCKSRSRFLNVPTPQPCYKNRSHVEADVYIHLSNITPYINSLSPNSGWSNFCTLVGHFSKLFEFAGLSRLKIPIFVLKSGCSLKKKKVFTWNRSAKFLFSFQNQGVL